MIEFLNFLHLELLYSFPVIGLYKKGTKTTSSLSIMIIDGDNLQSKKKKIQFDRFLEHKH